MAYKYVTRHGIVTAVNTMTLLTLNELAVAQPSERMPSTATRIVQLIVSVASITPDLTICGGASLIRLTGGCLVHGEESVPSFGISDEATTAGSNGEPCSADIIDVDIPIKGNELLNIGYEQSGIIWGASGFVAQVTVVVEY
jgi:hypothetical protein